MVTHPAPPQTRTCAIHAYGSSSRASAAPYAVPWGSGDTIGEHKVSLVCLPTGTLCSTAPSLPWVAWASLPHLHRYYAPLRLPPPRLGGFACRSPARYLACFRVFVVSQKGSWSSGSPRPCQGLWSPGPPLRESDQGDRWLSQVPELPLWMHAPLSDPGGVLDTRHTASRTAAFRRLHTVGFPLDSS